MRKELEEAIIALNNDIQSCNDMIQIKKGADCEYYKNRIKSWNIILNYIENSIPKEIIENEIKEINEEFKNRNTPDNNEWYLESEKYAYAEEKLNKLLEGK